jgi:hypothetical protein
MGAAGLSEPEGWPEALERGSAGTPIEGEERSGDLAVFAPYPGGALVAVIDGLGHGTEAAAAANLAADVLRGHAHEPVIELLQLCHRRLKSTRGAVMSLAAVHASEGSLSWIGVGNVEAVLLRANPNTKPASASIPLRGGVVGHQLPLVRAATLAIHRGDLLIFATDGVQTDFYEKLSPGLPPQALADEILGRSSRGTDDALVLVAKYGGGAG